MPGHKNSTGKSAGSTSTSKKNRKAKRPATSPLLETCTGRLDTTDTQHKRRDVSKALRGTFSSEETTQPDQGKQTLQTLSTVGYSDYLNYFNMSFVPQTPYGLTQTPYMQSPPYNAGQQPTQPPTWATELLERVGRIEQKLQVVESIEKTVSIINSKMTSMEEKIKVMEKRVTDTEAACEFISSDSEKQRREIKQATDEVKQMAKSCKSVEEKVGNLQKQKADLEAKVLDLETRSMRENLVFYGVAEGGESENCETSVKEICKNVLKVDKADDLVFDRAHRVGRRQAKPRPIIVKFHYYGERETVRRRSFECTAELKARNLGVGVQLPRDIREARKPLYEPMRKARDEGKTTKFVGKKLFINGVEYEGH